MKRKLLAVMLIITSIIGLTSCGTKVEATSDGSCPRCMTIVAQTYNYIIYKDNRTGVEYLVVIGEHSRAITPMYNEDGSLFTDVKEAGE